MRIKSFYDYTILYFQSCLSSSPSKPCFILHFKGVTLMLDCGLDIKEVLKFLPLPVVQRLVMLVHVYKCIIFPSGDGSQCSTQESRQQIPRWRISDVPLMGIVSCQETNHGL